MASITERAYAAGLLDGEGTVSILIAARALYGWNDHYELFVNISNTNCEAIEWLGMNFGGHTRTRKNTNGKPLHEWYLHDMDAIAEFLELVEPFIIIKRPQLEIAKMYIGLGKGSNGHFLNPDLQIARMDLCFDIRQLNSRKDKEELGG